MFWTVTLSILQGCSQAVKLFFLTLLFALQRMGYEVRVVGRGATLERSESGVGQNIGAG